MKSIVFSVFFAFAFLMVGSSSAAPTTVLPSMTPTPNSVVNIPVIVSNFTQICGITLTFYYNPAVLTVNPASIVWNTSLTGAFTTQNIYDDPVHTGMKVFGVTWVKSSPGGTLPNGATLFSVNATFAGGSTSLSWFTDIPSFCEYAGPDGLALSTVPMATYFSNGNIGCALPPTPGSISGPSAVCQNQSGVAYSIPAISGATGYTWTLPSGATIASGANTSSITVNFGNSSGNISVKGNNSCGDGPAGTLMVNINPNPSVPSAISGLSLVCPGQSGVAYSVTPVSNATSYLWNVPASGTIVSGSNSNQIVVDYGSNPNPGTVSVWGLNTCGQSASSSNLSVGFNTLPELSGSVQGLSTVCAGQTGLVFSVTPVANATGYAWTIPSGAVLVSGQNSTQIILDFPVSLQGSILVAPSNQCGSGTASAPLTITVNGTPQNPQTPAGPVQVLPNSLEVYEVPEIPGAILYQWVVTPNTAGAASGFSRIMPIAWSNFSGYAEVSVRAINNCGQSEFSTSLLVEVSNVVGLNDITETGNGLLYPNPASDHLNVKGSGLAGGYRIFNSMGQLMEQGPLDAGGSLDVSGLPAGVYHLEYTSEDMPKTERFQISR